MKRRIDPNRGETPRRDGEARHRSVAVAAAWAGPDQTVALAALVVEQVGENRGVEARIVELEAEIVASLVGALGPGGPDLYFMRCTA
jgi:hypothetical protein